MYRRVVDPPVSRAKPTLAGSRTISPFFPWKADVDSIQSAFFSRLYRVARIWLRTLFLAVGKQNAWSHGFEWLVARRMLGSLDVNLLLRS